MRSALLAVSLATFCAPTLARAELLLGLSGSTSEELNPARFHLDVPSLSLAEGGLPPGSGAGTGVDPAVALILGIFPGFGLGHYVAGSPAWTNWLLIDVVLIVAAVVVSAADAGALVALAWVAWVVEHVIQGIDAYHKAGGRTASALPPRDPSAALAWAASSPGDSAQTPRVVLARF